MTVAVPPLCTRVVNIARLIDAEFDEMPGMRLTEAQARRLWNVSQHECEAALEYLCEQGRLLRDGAGRYFRQFCDY